MLRDCSSFSIMHFCIYRYTCPATFWYGVGLLFQENLKVQYDSLREDTLFEKIVVKYKQGKL